MSDGMDWIKNIYVYQFEIKGRKVRGLSIAGQNLIRWELGLPLIRPTTWRSLSRDEKLKILRETREGATPEMLERFFGKNFTWSDPVTE